jgi:heat shock protein HslJ
VIRFVVALGLGGAMLAGCQATGPVLAGRTFLSVAVSENGAPRLLVAGTRIQLDFKDGGLSGNAGCNQFGGEYRLENGRLVMGDISQTAMGCDQPRAAQDDWLLRVLRAKPALAQIGDQLTIDAGSVVIRLADRRVAEPDQPLAGPIWTVDSVFTGEAVSSVPDGVVATLAFHADGTFDVDDGCNAGSGRWASVGGGIVVSDLALTKKACAGHAGALETAVVNVLREPSIAAAIQGNQLVLRAGTAGLGLRAR